MKRPGGAARQSKIQWFERTWHEVEACGAAWPCTVGGIFALRCGGLAPPELALRQRLIQLRGIGDANH